jgi:hypothetical protein
VWELLLEAGQKNAIITWSIFPTRNVIPVAKRAIQQDVVLRRRRRQRRELMKDQC